MHFGELIDEEKEDCKCLQAVRNVPGNWLQLWVSILLHGSARLSPSLEDSSRDPYVAIVVPFVAASSFIVFWRAPRTCDRGYMQKYVPAFRLSKNWFLYICRTQRDGALQNNLPLQVILCGVSRLFNVVGRLVLVSYFPIIFVTVTPVASVLIFLHRSR